MYCKSYKTVVAAACLLALAGCGGSNSSETTSLTATPGVAKGTVTGFGSVFVNGVEWHTDNAMFTLDDDSGNEFQL